MTFRPLPFLGNPHVQTILGNLWQGPGVRLPTRMHVVPLADGDALAVHDTVPPAWQPGKPIVVLVHGLGGSHRSASLQRLTNRFSAEGLRVVRVDLRGAGAGAHLASRVYNAACSEDVRAVVDYFARQSPRSDIYALGLSLGGNVVLNLAADAAEGTAPPLRAVAVLSPPVDLVLCSAMLSGLPFYDRYYARNLRRQVAEHQARFPQLPEARFPKNLTMRLFDDLYTAPRGGFADAMDYYRRASSLPTIPGIQIPTYILSARDDPFIAVPPLEGLNRLSKVRVDLVAKGGHLGFLGPDGAGGLRWGEEQLAGWLLSQIRGRQ